MMRRAGVLLALVVLLGGCAAPVAGVPSPVPSAAPSTELPPRPREVPVDGVDPCTLLTEEDRAALGLDQYPVLDVARSGLYNGGVTQLCSIRGFRPRVIRMAVELSVTGGIELFLRPGVRSEITPIQVAGFPAVRARPTTFDDFCDVVVDVAPGQVVQADVANGGGSPPIPQPELCREAERLAGLVMANLLRAR